MFKSVLSTLKDAILVYDEGRNSIVFANKSAAKIFEITHETLVDNPDFLKTVVHPEDRYGLDTVMMNEDNNYQYRIIVGNNNIKWLSEDVSFVFDEETKQTLQVSLIKDITTDVKAKKSIDRKIWFLSSLIDGVSANIFRINAAGQYTFVNHYYEKAEILTAKKLLGMSIYDFIAVEDIERIKHRFKYAINHPGTLQHYKHRRKTLKGETRLYNSYIVGVPGNDGKSIEIQGFSIDITDQELAIANLNIAKNDIEVLINNTHDLIWSIDKEKKYKYMNSPFKRMVKKSYQF